MTRWSVYKGLERIGSMTARSRKSVQMRYAADYKCPPEQIIVVGPGEKTPPEKALADLIALHKSKGLS